MADAARNALKNFTHKCTKEMDQNVQVQPRVLRCQYEHHEIHHLYREYFMSISSWIRRSFLSLMSLLIVAPALAIAASDNATLTVGYFYDGGFICSGIPTTWYGYESSFLGAYSPAGLTGGKTVVALIDESGCSYGAFLYISGFSSNPGPYWLTSVTCDGVTKSLVPAYFYYYSGTAQWYWPSLFGFSSKLGSNLSCTIVHS